MDDEYIDRVLSGDTEVFRYFLETYKDMAFNVAVSIVKDDQYAEEIVQDSFMKAFDGLKSFNKTAKFKTWFYRIIVNESFQRLRKLKGDMLLLNIAEFQESYDLAANEPINDKAEHVVSVMKSLPSKESLVLNLFYLEEYSLKEIENITGWSMANTKVILHRARKNLRIQLENKHNH
jgi:RNA polymerase sigma-70 factor (ECF subfamily)